MNQEFRIPNFGPVVTLADSTEIGRGLQSARNLLLRPAGAIKGPPIYSRLWALGAAASMATTIRAIAAPGGGTLADSHQTVALQVSRQGKSFLLFYNLPADECRGLFYLGDDGTFTSGSYDFTASAATWTVLATGLNNSARWYGSSQYGQWMLQNGVDDPVCVQLARTAKAPGIWRESGSNIRPNAATVSLAEPSKSSNTQASWVIPAGGSGARTGGVALTFTANADNFPGINGNSRIYVSIEQDPYAAAITSELTGSGTPADPYHYRIHTGPTAAASSNSAVRDFVNADSKVISILTASSADNTTTDTQSWALTVLANGAGTGDSDGFTDRTVTVYLRYWDTGVNSLGYEGISSDISNEVIITADSQNDIVVAVPLDSTAAGGRFDGVRIYLQFGEDAEAAWYLVDPSNPVTNGAPLTTCTIGFTDDYPLVIQSINVATNTFRIDGHGLQTGYVIYIASSGSVPGGTTAGIPVYVINATDNTFKVSATEGGAAINITTAGTGTRSVSRHYWQFTKANHNLVNGDIVRLSNITVPGGYFSTGTDYYVTEATSNTFSLSTTVNGLPISIAVTIGGVPTPSVTTTVTQKRVTIGSNTPFGAVMYADQNQPLSHRYLVNVNGTLWRGACTTYPERLYPSKPATEDELAPEGANVDGYVIAQGVNESGAAAITALFSDGYRLHFHTRQKIGIIDPANPDNQQFPPGVTAGALNGSALVNWTGNSLFYLGADLGLYQFDGARYGKRSADLVTTGVASYIRAAVDPTVVGRDPDCVFLMSDIPNQFIWFWLPASAGGTVGFAYDFAANGITGPFDTPLAYAAARMEPERPEIVFADATGNLFVWDTTAQHDYGDTLPTQSAFTAHAIPDTPPVGQAGYPTVEWDGSAYRQAIITEFETGFYDLGRPSEQKIFTGLIFTTLPNSRGLLKVSVIGKNTGLLVSRTFGDVGEYNSTSCSHRLLFNRRDTAIKLKIQILGAEQKPWTIRDMTLLWKGVGQV